ncbi:hypothetical protein PAL_GLEAN10009701 [Pteropus alecto]|uniref:Uncharacterized protein n=1 Tax=Pteropus alecto TaxID=9402 RepID=L5KRW0_PTEAL|nr:hypothetical protein PAL_GLEAN10009701 [Pteropus alecto]
MPPSETKMSQTKEALLSEAEERLQKEQEEEEMPKASLNLPGPSQPWMEIQEKSSAKEPPCETTGTPPTLDAQALSPQVLESSVK